MARAQARAQKTTRDSLLPCNYALLERRGREGTPWVFSHFPGLPPPATGGVGRSSSPSRARIGCRRTRGEHQQDSQRSRQSALGANIRDRQARASRPCGAGGARGAGRGARRAGCGAWVGLVALLRGPGQGAGALAVSISRIQSALGRVR